MKVHVFRLKPAQDLKLEIEKFAQTKNIKAGFIMTCVGSLRAAQLRMPGATPNSQDIRQYKGHFEIVSLVGSVSINGCHLHLSISDKDSAVFGGHLKEGCKIGLTAEIVIGEEKGKTFIRELDVETGFSELVINSKAEK